MMELEFVGTNHNDPLGRQHLVRYLDHLKTEHATPPAFVSLEFDQAWLPRIREQRQRLSELLESGRHVQAGSLLDTLAASVAFEADAHHAIWPDAPVIWLDEGRLDTDLAKVEQSLRRLAQIRRDVYVRLLAAQGGGGDQRTSTVLEKLSKAVWTESDHDIQQHGYDRDARFLQVVLKAIADHPGEWGVVIVGAGHADKRDRRSLLSELMARGFKCCTRNLRDADAG